MIENYGSVLVLSLRSKFASLNLAVDDGFFKDVKDPSWLLGSDFKLWAPSLKIFRLVNNLSLKKTCLSNN